MDNTNTKPVDVLKPIRDVIIKTLNSALMSLLIKELKLTTRDKPRSLLFFLK